MPTMPTKPRQQKDEVCPKVARVLRPIVLQETACNKVFDKFNEEAHIGSIIGIAGDDFALIAVDARRTDDASQALHRITKKLVFGQVGNQCAAAHAASSLRARLFTNEYMRRREIPSECVTVLLSEIKKNQGNGYNQPSAMLAGLDHEGKGAIYAFNPLGFNERVKYRALGVASTVLQPILVKDLAPVSLPSSEPSRQSIQTAKGKATALETNRNPKKISFHDAFELIVRAFKAATEHKKVYTGNVLVLDAITRKGCFKHEVMLRSPRKSIESWV